MELQPLYDIKERLEAAAVAGTNLVGEDFRLRRAREALSPLAAASPVFAKIAAGVDKLLAAQAGEQGGALLDALALVDAVTYTQGGVGVAGELEPLAPGECAAYCEASYGQLHPLVEALTTKGSGRWEVVETANREHPEYFSDFRVLSALIRYGLPDTYGSSIVMPILQRMGPAIVPLLEQGFDPAGKKEMERRVRLIAAAAGAQANGFYLEQLPQAKRDVREALIYALRLDGSNAGALLELCQTEKGACRDVAHRALAWMEAPEAWEYLGGIGERDPSLCGQYLWASPRPAAGELAGRLLARVLMPYVEDPRRPLEDKALETVEGLLSALGGKPGETVADAFRLAVRAIPALSRPDRREKVVRAFHIPQTAARLGEQAVDGYLSQHLCRLILARPGPAYYELAMELYRERGDGWFAPALAAKLCAEPDAAKCYGWAAERFYSGGLLGGKPRRELAEAFRAALAGLWWDGKSGFWEEGSLSDPATVPGRRSAPPAAPLDIRWADLLMDCGEPCQGVVTRLMEQRAEELRGNRKAQLYLYQMLAERGTSPCGELVDLLARLGWTQWAGLAAKQAETSGRANLWTAKRLLEALPITDRERAEELMAVDRIAHTRKCPKTARLDWPEDAVYRQYQQWGGN